MVDRLQYQNQIYGSQVVPPSQQLQHQQQQSQPQIIIPPSSTTTLPLTPGGGAGIPTTTILPHKQNHLNNTVQLRYIPAQPGARIIQRVATVRQVSQHHQGQRIVHVHRATSAQLIRAPPGIMLYQNQVYGHQQQHQSISSGSTARPQRYLVNNPVQYRHIQQQGPKNIIYEMQGSQQHFLASGLTTFIEQRQVINNVVHARPVKQKQEVNIVEVAAKLPQEIQEHPVDNEVMGPTASSVAYSSSSSADAAALPPPHTDAEMTISINNVVCNYSLPMHIDLRKLALNSWNCAYDRTGSVLTKQKRHPGCHVKVYNSGKVYIVGCKSEAASRQAARSVGREIQKIMGKTDQKICLRKFRINNILATCKFPFGIQIDQVNRQYPKETYYEPELTVGLIWRMTEPKASIRIHTTGTIVVTGATSEADVAVAVEKIYEYIKDFRCDPSKISHAAPRKRKTPQTATYTEFSNVKRSKLRDSDDEDGDVVTVDDEVMGPTPSSAEYSPPHTDAEMTISINNVVCNYSLPMHIDLRKLALNSWNCAYDRTGSVLTKQKRHPGCHVKVYNSGKVYIVGCKSEAASRQAARSVGREIQKIMGKTDQKICLRKFRINNILATCKFPFGIQIDLVNRQYPKETYYEPELTVGLIWRMTEPKASIRIHTTGTIVVTGATSEADVAAAVEKIYENIKDFRCDPSKISHVAPRKRKTPQTATYTEFSNVKRTRIAEFDDEDGDFVTGMDQLFDDENELVSLVYSNC